MLVYSTSMRIFISGGTGYIGRALLPRLLTKHEVTALVRPGSQSKLPPGVTPQIGNALDASTFNCDGAHTFIHLVGTPHPAPWKAEEFKAVDLVSLKASAAVAARAGVKHFIFLSVAQPAPVMRAYIEVRAECERILRDTGLTTTIVRPWYVLGPGHYWPYAIIPIYALARQIPTLRDGATRLGLVTLKQMVDTLNWSVNNPPAATRILGVPEIKLPR